jgi:hypothetical protein
MKNENTKQIETSALATVSQLCLSVLMLAAPIFAQALPAFPGAQGGGAVSVGGRGGRVINVTSLADSGAGTLRECVQAAGPRICVFKVAGEIKLNTGIYITNPYLTVAGQTAPGGGIQITGVNSSQHLIMIAAHDVIWQYTKFRKGYNPNNLTEFADGANISLFAGSYNMMIDHNSVEWNQDEGISIWSDTTGAVKNVTVSFNLIAEGLKQHSTGLIVGGSGSSGSLTTDIDIHHNLTMNNSHRNPLLTNKSSRLINNIFYNYEYYATQIGGGVMLDAIGNKYKRGPLNVNAPLVHEIQMYSVPSLFIFGNTGYFQPNPDGDQWLLVSQVPGQNGYDSGTSAPTSSRRLTRLPDTQYPITVEHVNNIDGSILPTVGASRRLNCDGTWVSNRDSADSRLVNQYQTNTGVSRIPVSQDDVGGFPVLAPGTPCADADRDGMPDVWEIAHGLNPNSAADASADRDGDGYTNIEEYLAGGGLTSTTPTTPPPTTTTVAPVPTTTTMPPVATTTTTTLPPPMPTTALSISNLVAISDSVNTSYKYNFTGTVSFHRLFLDTDNNASTGFSRGGIGAEFMIENTTLYIYSGTSGAWGWTARKTVAPTSTASSMQWTLTRTDLGSPSSLKVVGQVAGSGSAPLSGIVSQVFGSTASVDSIAPSVSIQAPVNGSTVRRGQITTISAVASDNVGVVKVEIYVNDRLLCTDSGAPYSCSWSVPRTYTTYTLKARALDAQGNAGVSSVVTVRSR